MLERNRGAIREMQRNRQFAKQATKPGKVLFWSHFIKSLVSNGSLRRRPQKSVQNPAHFVSGQVSQKAPVSPKMAILAQIERNMLRSVTENVKL